MSNNVRKEWFKEIEAEAVEEEEEEEEEDDKIQLDNFVGRGLNSTRPVVNRLVVAAAAAAAACTAAPPSERVIFALEDFNRVFLGAFLSASQAVKILYPADNAQERDRTGLQ
ncbi:hypothetical protein M0804_010705 [Polistes exclamans]|nr:hypothetical protein M0804_010705 [Polistes exclamans]